MQYDLTKNIYSTLSVHALHLPGKRVHVQNDKDFAKAREKLKECMKDYRIPSARKICSFREGGGKMDFDVSSL